MNVKVSADLIALKFIFNKNRSLLAPIFVILVSVFLFFQFIIPQVNSLLETIKQARELSLKIEVLEDNLELLTNVNENTLDLQLKILNAALPVNKDFIGILNSIYTTAQKTGVNLGSFSFKVGDIAKSEDGGTFPVVKVSVPVNSSIPAINSFVETISKTVPLAEVSSVKMGNLSSMVSLSFYYKSLDAANYNPDDRITSISQKGLTLVDQLSKFENLSLGQ